MICDLYIVKPFSFVIKYLLGDFFTLFKYFKILQLHICDMGKVTSIFKGRHLWFMCTRSSIDNYPGIKEKC